MQTALACSSSARAVPSHRGTALACSSSAAGDLSCRGTWVERFSCSSSAAGGPSCRGTWVEPFSCSSSAAADPSRRGTWIEPFSCAPVSRCVRGGRRRGGRRRGGRRRGGRRRVWLLRAHWRRATCLLALAPARPWATKGRGATHVHAPTLPDSSPLRPHLRVVCLVSEAHFLADLSRSRSFPRLFDR